MKRIENHPTFFPSFTVMLFSLLIAPLLSTSVLAAPAARAGCDLNKARLELPKSQSALAPQSSAPSYVSLGIGIQNYTCDRTTHEYTSKGAVAELFDISCLYGKPEFHTIQDHLYEMWLGATDSLTIHKVIEDLGDSQKVLGQHYFIENPDKSKGGLVPKWDFTSASHKGNSEAYIIGAKVGSVSVNKADVDSLSLKSVKGHLADTVYRVDTKAGQPPASPCVAGTHLQVKYAAKYWFFGGSLKKVGEHKL
jgi:hypothetical protein